MRAAVILSLLVFSVNAWASNPHITVIYPKPDQVVHAIDSTFILGNIGVKPEKNWRLTVNGYATPIHRDGGFIAFVPVTPGAFTFDLEILQPRSLHLQGNDLSLEERLAGAEIAVQIPQPRRTLPGYELTIAGDYNPPSGDLTLSAGDMLAVMFQGTPGMIAWFSMPGVVDSVPMSETEPRQQPYWGESVFGAGAVPDSVMIRGVYSGLYRIPESARADTARVLYHLAPPKAMLRPFVLSWPLRVSALRSLLILNMPDSISAPAGYRISLNPSDYPRTVRFIDSAQTIRYGPALGYFAIFQPQGVEALAVGAEGDWYRLKLSATQYAWCARKSVTALPAGHLPPSSQIVSLRTYSDSDKVLIEIPLRGRHPFRVVEDDSRTLRLQLFGVTSNTDWIRYDFSDSLVSLITWAQPEDDLYELKIDLTQDVWGYDTYYKGNTFYLQLNRPPSRVRYLWGKTVVLDPGHSADPGSVGPTGLTEAEANLGLALTLKKALEKKGARVVMTRSDMSHVPLQDRPVIAKLADADLYISIHNNALPDGVDPFTNNGVSTYYYHPHSIELARAVQREMIPATGLRDHGLFHGNLLVNRPTQYPAVLVECAFMIIPEQEALLKTERFRRKIADAITRGVEHFLESYDHGR